MSDFTKLAQQIGIKEQRAYELESALNMLHTTLCKLDNGSRSAVARLGLNTILRQYAVSNSCRDIAAELQELGTMQAIERTDLSGEVNLEEKIDRLHDALLDFIELQLPGAQLCFKSLALYRESVINKLHIQPEGDNGIFDWLENNVSLAWFVQKWNTETIICQHVALAPDVAGTKGLLVVHNCSVCLYPADEGVEFKPLFMWFFTESVQQLTSCLLHWLSNPEQVELKDLFKILYGLKR